jgi:hypothetical protein
MLKELRGLSPWTWDARVGKHPPGASALKDFERVRVVNGVLAFWSSSVENIIHVLSN